MQVSVPRALGALIVVDRCLTVLVEIEESSAMREGQIVSVVSRPSGSVAATSLIKHPHDEATEMPSPTAF